MGSSARKEKGVFLSGFCPPSIQAGGGTMRMSQMEKEGFGEVEASKKLGKTQSYLSKIESGQRRFDVLQLKEFAKLYKKSLDYFVK